VTAAAAAIEVDLASCHTDWTGMRAPSHVSGDERLGEVPNHLGAPAVSIARPKGARPNPPEAEIVEALSRSEGWAAQELWDRHAASVRRFLARALGPKTDVDDLTQETFMRVFSSITALREAGALREYVLVVAFNVLRRELRRRWVRRNVLLSDDGAVPEMEGPTADPEAREALARCYAILDKLGARERAAFTLRYMEERTLEEVASILDVSLSTAKRLVNKSTERVDKHVGSDEGLRSFFGTRRRLAASAGSRDGTEDDTDDKKDKAHVQG